MAGYDFAFFFVRLFQPRRYTYEMRDTDLQLLGRYTRQNAEDAFTEIVRRHLDLVFSAALRQVHSPQLAEEVAQSAFTDLARQAHRLAPDTILAAWLYQVTRRTAIDVVRRESRRQVREQIACQLDTMNAANDDWTQVEPFLDEAMHALDQTDRTAVLLRYFENKSLREVGEALGTNEDAARKRVNRAVERLRAFFAKHGVTVSAGGLVIVISANSVQAAPAGLAVTISTAAALTGTAVHTATALAATKIIAMTTIQKALIVTTLAATLGTGIYEMRRASRWQAQTEALLLQQDSLNQQNQQLQKERDDAATKLAAAQYAIGQPRRDVSELIKLRAEVAKLRRNSEELAELKATIENDPIQSMAKSWLTRVTQLKQRVTQLPGQTIPELQFLTEQDWLNAVKGSKQLETDADYAQALSTLRISAKFEFAGMVRSALLNYAQANNGQPPGDLSQLQPYFASPVDASALQRYQIAQSGVVTEMPTPLSDQDDEYYQISADGISSTSGGVAENILQPALQAFAAANNGQKPADPSQLLPYATTPAQQAVLQKLIQSGRP
jgi:RNA polymerase sigma factor (sigma-70 family)